MFNNEIQFLQRNLAKEAAEKRRKIDETIEEMLKEGFDEDLVKEIVKHYSGR